jgi:predicted naringenin-chalcone synthase
MFINGLGTATPPRRYTQLECWEALQVSEHFPKMDWRARTLLKRVLLGDNGINTRFLAPAPLRVVFDINPDTLHRRFSEHAPRLATQAAERALAEAGRRPEDLDAVIISTCTGYLCPGLTSYVVERLGLRSEVLTLDLVGQGCGAALPNLSMAEALLSARRCEQVLSVCVEVCSAAFYLDDDPGVLISICLFGDGAGAAVLANAPHPERRRIQWQASRSLITPAQRDALRFEQREGMLRNILTRSVPRLAAEHADRVLNELLGKTGIQQADIRTWIWHAGGRDVLLALQERLGLSPTDTYWSRRILSEYGNLSSAFIYFVLQAALIGQAPGGWWWMSSFGAGFSCHGALLEVA